MCIDYLSTENYYKTLYQEVLPFADWVNQYKSDLPKTDTGIDLVATHFDGTLTAIQCKNYPPTYRIQKSDIDSFFTASGITDFTHRLIITTTDHWSENAQNSLKNQHIQGEFLREELRKIAREYPCIGNVRGRGLMTGIEIVDDRASADHMGSYPADSVLAAEIQKACFNNKLLLERGGRGGTVVRLLCPITITREECEMVIDRFKKAVGEAVKAVRGS